MNPITVKKGEEPRGGPSPRRFHDRCFDHLVSPTTPTTAKTCSILPN